MQAFGVGGNLKKVSNSYPASAAVHTCAHTHTFIVSPIMHTNLFTMMEKIVVYRLG